MSISTGKLSFRQVGRGEAEGVDESIDLYEVVGGEGEDRVHSCVALCRQSWREDWPALGGTRWLGRSRSGGASTPEQLRQEASELAKSMFIKNRLLRLAENALVREDVDFARTRSIKLFGWQGGKGVILTPFDPELDLETNKRKHLTPLRLIAHGRLIEELKGEYLGSKDQGVGTPELKWIERATSYTIGLGCERDTGEATATGVIAGLEQSAREMTSVLGNDPEQPLKGLSVLVVGAGKVGIPVIRFLASAGAKVSVYDPKLDDDRGSVDRLFEGTLSMGGAVEQTDLGLLHALHDAGRVHATETAALSDPEVQVVSPNGGLSRWLAGEVEGRRRCDLLADTARSGNLRLVLGAGNDQVSTTDAGKDEREDVLACFDGTRLVFVPDPLVSPGGVIAVSHEQSESWSAERVNEDTRRLVTRSVRELFARCGTDRPESSKAWVAFEAMLDDEWEDRS
ncbi:MAG: NAD(P)-dependent oxidoreductase [Acidobacteriota bacterium]